MPPPGRRDGAEVATGAVAVPHPDYRAPGGPLVAQPRSWPWADSCGFEFRRRMSATAASESARAEAERQLAAAAERHREVLASMQESGRPEAGQHIAVKSVGRAVQLVSFALKRAARLDVAFDRLVELTGWEPDLVREGLEAATPEPWFVARLAPPGIDARAVAEAAAAFEAIGRLRDLTQRALADVDGGAGELPPPAAADIDDLHDRWQTAWRAWRERPASRET
jgi:hypothetical protein